MTGSINKSNLKLIKGTLHDGKALSPKGLVICKDHESTSGEYIFKFSLSNLKQDHFLFVFGFTGHGSYYRVQFDLSQGLVLLSFIYDGIFVYIQHVYLRLLKTTDFEIKWSSPSIKIFANGWSIINVYDEHIRSGSWGIGSTDKSVVIPDIYCEVINAASKNRILCLGDGFSNPRWPNRSFLGWPELLFGKREDYLNFAVAAGNSRRVSNIFRCILDYPLMCDIEHLILSCGSDDLIEGEEVGAFLIRLKSIIKCIDLSKTRLYIVSLPPRSSRREEIKHWNSCLRSFTLESGGKFIDVYQPLQEDYYRLMYKGDYPNAAGQLAMAKEIAGSLEVDLPSHYFDSFNKSSKLRPKILDKIVRKLHKKAGKLISDIPELKL